MEWLIRAIRVIRGEKSIKNWNNKYIQKKCVFLRFIWKRQQMSASENQQKAMARIADRANRVINYEWEIQHHKQMHEAYEKFSKD